MASSVRVSCNRSQVTELRLSLQTSKLPLSPALIPRLCGMKPLGVFLLPSGWDASSSQRYPEH